MGVGVANLGLEEYAQGGDVIVATASQCGVDEIPHGVMRIRGVVEDRLDLVVVDVDCQAVGAKKISVPFLQGERMFFQFQLPDRSNRA